MTKPSQSLCSPAGCAAEGHHVSGVAAIYILTPIIYLSIKPRPASKGKGFFLTAADFFLLLSKKNKIKTKNNRKNINLPKKLPQTQEDEPLSVA